MHKPRQPAPLRSVLLLSGFSLSLILTQAGCPQGAELENPGAWTERIGTGGTSGGGALDFSTVNCAASLLKPTNSSGIASVDFMNTSCAKSFCHGNNFVVGLDLRPDSGFTQRVLDVSAMYGGIACPGDALMECIPAGCPPAGTAKLIDSSDPTASWIMKKSHDMQGDCGDWMPTGGPMLTADQSACLEAIVNATAALK